MSAGNSRGHIRTAIKQDTGHGKGSYTSDGAQAYYLHRAGAEETWFTTANKAIDYWEANGGELWVGKSTKTLNRIR